MKKAFKLFKECQGKGIYQSDDSLEKTPYGGYNLYSEGQTNLQWFLYKSDLVDHLKSKLAEYGTNHKSIDELNYYTKAEIDSIINDLKIKYIKEKINSEKLATTAKNQPLNKEMFENWPNETPQTGTINILDPCLTNPVKDSGTSWTVDINTKGDEKEEQNEFRPAFDKVFQEIRDIRENGPEIKGDPFRTAERTKLINAHDDPLKWNELFWQSIKMETNGDKKYSKLKNEMISFFNYLLESHVLVRDTKKEIQEKIKELSK